MLTVMQKQQKKNEKIGTNKNRVCRRSGGKILTHPPNCPVCVCIAEEWCEVELTLFRCSVHVRRWEEVRIFRSRRNSVDSEGCCAGDVQQKDSAWQTVGVWYRQPRCSVLAITRPHHSYRPSLLECPGAWWLFGNTQPLRLTAGGWKYCR